MCLIPRVFASNLPDCIKLISISEDYPRSHLGISDEIHASTDGPAVFLQRIWLKPTRTYVQYACLIHEVN
jgi:hypothetical protein